ncbi:aminoglycoside 6-adenylyltransferase [Hominenteromicrobium sp.]|uniref:aminoglycoside 6-adenylyltransferase n=1 Tax=Hominenteromicrobium sp. TaxID=3073581 RepID=UPI003AF131B3
MIQRTPEEMMRLILSRAENDAHIRVVGMEGSRTNKNIPKDRFQDFDVTYFVDDPALYTKDDTWVNVFGERLIMQKPEDMELFPAVEEGYSFLMFFTDYNKIDLTILPLTALEDYLNGDGLREILLDKDGRVEEKPTPTDEEYHIQKPGARSFDDCCNEFWNTTTYVVKGLCRRELLFAIDLLTIMRNELLRMLSWQVGSAYGFTFSVGKNYKFIDQYLPAEQWQALLSTYRTDSVENIWRSLFTCHELFRDAAKNFAAKYGYTYPDYDENISRYVRDMYAEYEAK